MYNLKQLMISKLAETENRYKVEIEKVGVMLTYETRSLTKVYEIVLLNPGYHTCNIYYNYIYIECFLIQHIYFLLMYVYTEVLYKDAASYNLEKFRITLPKRKREDNIYIFCEMTLFSTELNSVLILRY